VNVDKYREGKRGKNMGVMKRFIERNLDKKFHSQSFLWCGETHTVSLGSVRKNRANRSLRNHDELVCGNLKKTL
jgi:hypothetical protein